MLPVRPFPALSLLGFVAAVACAQSGRVRAEAAAQAHIEVQPAVPSWPRPCMLIPEFPEAPALEGALDEALWAKAGCSELRFHGNSNKAEPCGARFRAGHRDGTLYLLMEIDWPGEQAPKCAAKDRDGPIWEDDGAELFLAPVDDLDHPRQLVFNLGGVKAEIMHTYDPVAEKPIKSDPAWCPAWNLKCRKDGKRWTARTALPLKEVLGLEGGKGEVFRFELVCNRPSFAQSEAHWAPILGKRNNRPAFFGYVVLTGSDPAAFEAKELKIKSPADVLVVETAPASTVLTGTPFQVTLLNPLAPALKNGYPIPLKASLRGVPAAEKTAAQNIALEGAALRLTISNPETQDLDTDVEFSHEQAGVLLRLPVRWRSWSWIDAADPLAVGVEGKSSVDVYPRGVGRQIRVLRPNARLIVPCAGRALYLRFPIAFPPPGPRYGAWQEARVRAQIDGGEWKEYAPAASPRIVTLAEDLAAGPHTLVLEPVGGTAAIESIGMAREPLTDIHGVLFGDLAELLTDVRAEVFSGEKRVRSEPVRAPHNGRFELLGLEPGAYRVRLLAAGWQPVDIKEAVIERPGQKLDLGVLYMRREETLGAWAGRAGPAFGRTLCAVPDSEVTIPLHLWAPQVQRAELVSAYKTVALEIKAQEAERLGRWNDVGRITLKLPKEIPSDLYALRYTFAGQRGAFGYTVAQAVCVRRAIQGEFMLAGCGHMNTWGQETAEYLAKAGSVAELAGARALLVANEVNAAYVSGALSGLRIPYLVVRGNHTVGRWEEFYCAGSTVVDDGPLRLVTHARMPYEDWAEPQARLIERPEARVRVLLCFEAYAPLALIRQAKVNLLFDGHSDDPHPERKDFPPGVLHTRAPTQETLRFLPLTADGFPERIKTEKDLPVLEIPRNGPAPLRVEWSAPNDGSAGGLTATLRNDSALPFPAACFRMLLKAGTYELTGAKIAQQFTSDDGKTVVLDVEAGAPAHGSTVVTARPAR